MRQWRHGYRYSQYQKQHYTEKPKMHTNQLPDYTIASYKSIPDNWCLRQRICQSCSAKPWCLAIEVVPAKKLFRISKRKTCKFFPCSFLKVIIFQLTPFTHNLGSSESKRSFLISILTSFHFHYYKWMSDFDNQIQLTPYTKEKVLIAVEAQVSACKGGKIKSWILSTWLWSETTLVLPHLRSDCPLLTPHIWIISPC